jgi:hypothetical protein
MMLSPDLSLNRVVRSTVSFNKRVVVCNVVFDISAASVTADRGV